MRVREHAADDVMMYMLLVTRTGQTECLNILLQRCPDIEVDARNTLGFTPLMKAALQGRTKCAKILLFAGESPCDNASLIDTDLRINNDKR